jgi:hypothetical protein
LANKKFVPYASNYHPATFGEFWTLESSHFQISKFGRLKIFDYLRGSREPACHRPTTAHGRLSNQRARDDTVVVQSPHAIALPTCTIHHLALSAAAGRSQANFFIFVLPIARSAQPLSCVLLCSPH